jgi:hypothetical protein
LSAYAKLVTTKCILKRVGIILKGKRLFKKKIKKLFKNKIKKLFFKKLKIFFRK